MGRKNYSREFKVSAVKLVEEQGYSVGEAGRSLGVDASNVRNWVEKYGGEGREKPTGEAGLRVEVRRLRKENLRLVMERDILKKAAAFFAKESG